LYAAVTVTTYCSSSKPAPPPQAPEQLHGTQEPTQFLGGQGVVLLQGVLVWLVLFTQGQEVPLQDMGTIDAAVHSSSSRATRQGVVLLHGKLVRFNQCGIGTQGQEVLLQDT
jgi:hypothetical protein